MKRSTIFFAVAGAAAVYYLFFNEGEASASGNQGAGAKPGNQPGGGSMPGQGGLPGGQPGTPGTLPGGQVPGTGTGPTDIGTIIPALKAVPSARFPAVRAKLQKYFTVVRTPLIGNASGSVQFELDMLSIPPANASRGDVLCEAIQENGRHLFVPSGFALTDDSPLKISVIGLRDDLVDAEHVNQLQADNMLYVYLDPQGYRTYNP